MFLQNIYFAILELLLHVCHGSKFSFVTSVLTRVCFKYRTLIYRLVTSAPSMRRTALDQNACPEMDREERL